MAEISLGATLLSLIIWLGLLVGWGQFWRCDQRLEARDEGGRMRDETFIPYSPSPISHPSVCAVVPARNEAELLPVTLRSLLNQNYPGNFQIVLVDDQSTDGTAQIAQQTAEELGKFQQFNLIAAQPLPAGWSGKLWAMEQGFQKAQTFSPEYILLTDADIEHDSDNLQRLVTKAIQEDLDLVSVMVRLRCESFWEKFLIPAFVFFFQKLYPFRWVNHPNNPTAAAAGGCILIRREALEQIGGLAAIRQALIDDCALAQAVKSGDRGQGTGDRGTPTPYTPHPTPGKIWLGLSDRTHSLRPYPSLETIWNMVARTAFTQLNYNPLLLVGTLIGMALVYLVPPLGLMVGVLTGSWMVALLGLVGWLLMALAYFPTIRFYHCSPLFAVGLPAIAVLYNLMTLDSALRYWRGQGGAWKGRVYPHT
ncbi:glycosyltransferase [Kovacikia minuta CCNUW1]|uniref:glycosyltransferase n=1 Tax=Kovacikia minuta TaxID=2931930 RepID=UPI001CC9F9EE|nr:glycosyltransferase [Kovacikia minuta]UBF24615.1 glycosyltransferase [Kovacikia minuta CCNUW1]